METKFGCATALILLNLYFASSAEVRYYPGGVTTCILPYVSNITSEIQEVGELVKDAVTVANATVTNVRQCVSASGSSQGGSSGAATQALEACLTFVSATLIPEIQGVVQKYQHVMPMLENLKDTISVCMDKSNNHRSSTTPTPSSTTTAQSYH